MLVAALMYLIMPRFLWKGVVWLQRDAPAVNVPTGLIQKDQKQH